MARSAVAAARRAQAAGAGDQQAAPQAVTRQWKTERLPPTIRPCGSHKAENQVQHLPGGCVCVWYRCQALHMHGTGN
jgi:hypothetical protein